ncbi:MAG TPA: alpha/beta hydrolase-fold protein [Mucilaginibacter sp.]|jgi:hypothetical protein|nr:alpha/beta hydrolase-fold protein [Mucilaginibacter sp.]
MKRFLLPVLALLFAACGRSKTDNDVIKIGKIDNLHSNILGEDRKIWVYVPDGAKDTSKRFPVLYLLDGDAHFSSVVGMIQELSGVNGNTICPDMIVVGIPNTDRTRDLTPTHSLLMPDGSKPPFLKSSGGGEKFTAFLEKELIPHIDSLYPAAPYRMLTGHSFGGLTVMNVLVHHSGMFNAYIAIDPSMWWDKQKLLGQARDAFKQNNYKGKSLYLGVANTMPAKMDTVQVRLDTTGGTYHIRSILQLKDLLQEDSKNNGLNFSYAYYKNDNHGSVPLISEYDALHFLFSFYSIPQDMNEKLGDPKSKFDPVAALNAHYADVSGHMGYKILPDENMVNQLAYYYMQSKAPEKAYAMFAMNIKNYPKSGNTYDGMGDYYADQKDKTKAIEYYKKALSINDNPDTKKKLDSLEEKK